MSRLCWLGAAALVMAAACPAQNLSDVIKQGEQVFAKTCATGYCHGARGGPGGAPRLAGRRFDQAYIASVVTRGVPGTGMASFATTLARPDLVAVIAYVATLNGIVDPNIGGESAAGVTFRGACADRRGRQRRAPVQRSRARFWTMLHLP
jgi:cytochrome c553